MAAPAFPTRHGTVKAQVLAALLAHRKLTHLDVWREAGSSRCSHHVFILRSENNFPIQTADLVVGCSDGRSETIAQYSLTDEFINSIDQVERDAFIRSVHQARAELRNGGGRHADHK